MTETAAYDLLRRVPPSKIEQRLYDTIRLAPDLTDTLLSTVDIPLKIVQDSDSNSPFVACEFNRDLDSHRSPHSNKYFPALPDGQKIPARLRNMETKANLAFGAYRQLYMQGGISSVYLWTIEDKLFGFGVFIKNEVNTKLRTGQPIQGTIDCSDVVEVDESSKRAKYTLTSSVLLKVSVDVGLSAPVSVSGSTADRKETVKEWNSDDDHIVNIGELIEMNAARFRDTINTIYVSKMKHIVELIANQDTNAVQKSLADAIKKRFGK
jgi:capping protein beta